MVPSENSWYNPDATKKQLNCILNGCRPCPSQLYCKEHDKPAKVAAVPYHCEECGEYLYDDKRDRKGMFS